MNLGIRAALQTTKMGHCRVSTKPSTVAFPVYQFGFLLRHRSGDYECSEDFPFDEI